MDDSSESQNERYAMAAAELGGAIERIARGYEADAALRGDLVQDIHLALWRSLARFDGRCSLSTWTYRVAHNVAASYALKRRRGRVERSASLEELERVADQDDPEATIGERRALDRLMALILALAAPDRQLLLLYLEDLDAAAIGEITGMSPGAVSTKIHRLKALLTRRFAEALLTRRFAEGGTP